MKKSGKKPGASWSWLAGICSKPGSGPSGAASLSSSCCLLPPLLGSKQTRAEAAVVLILFEQNKSNMLVIQASSRVKSLKSSEGLKVSLKKITSRYR